MAWVHYKMVNTSTRTDTGGAIMRATRRTTRASEQTRANGLRISKQWPLNN